MRHCIAILLVLSMLLLCSCATSGNGGGTPAHTPEATWVPPTAEIQTVVLGYVGGGKVMQDWAAEVEAGINLLLVDLGTPLRLRIQMLDARPLSEGIQNGGALDIARDLHVDLLIEDYGALTRTLYDGGYIADLTDAMVYHPDLYAITPERAWKETMIDGRIMCFPLMKDYWGTRSLHSMVGVRPDMLRDLSLPFPETKEELVSVLEAAQLQSAWDPLFTRHKLLHATDRPPYALHRTYDEWPFMVDEQSRFVFYNDGTVEPYFGSSVFLQDAAFLSELWNRGLLVSEKSTDYDLAGYTGCIAALPPKFLPAPPEELSYDETFGGVVQRSEAKSIGVLMPDKPYFRTGPCAEYAFYIPSHCQDVEAALAMLEFLYLEREVTDMLFYGPVGKFWNLNEDGTIDSDTFIGTNMHYPFVHEFQERQRYREEPREEPATTLFAGSGFLFNEAMDAYGIDFTDAYLLRAGVYPLSETQAILDALNTQGYQELWQECRRQYSEYLEQCK